MVTPARPTVQLVMRSADLSGCPLRRASGRAVRRERPPRGCYRRGLVRTPRSSRGDSAGAVPAHHCRCRLPPGRPYGTPAPGPRPGHAARYGLARPGCPVKPELRLAGRPEADCTRKLHHDAKAERIKRCGIEGLRLGEITNGHTQVVECVGGFLSGDTPTLVEDPKLGIPGTAKCTAAVIAMKQEIVWSTLNPLPTPSDPQPGATMLRHMDGLRLPVPAGLY